MILVEERSSGNAVRRLAIGVGVGGLFGLVFGVAMGGDRNAFLGAFVGALAGFVGAGLFARRGATPQAHGPSTNGGYAGWSPVASPDEDDRASGAGSSDSAGDSGGGAD